MHLSSSSMELNGGLKDLRALWDTTKDVWTIRCALPLKSSIMSPWNTASWAPSRAIERPGTGDGKMQA